MSKRATKVKNTCPYILKRGDRKGKACKKSCRDKFCKDHNPKKLKYLDNYNQEQKNNRKQNRDTKKLKAYEKEIDINNLPTLKNILEKASELLTSIKKCKRKVAGYKIYKGESREKVIDELLKPLGKKCNYRKKNEDPIGCEENNGDRCKRCEAEYGLNVGYRATYRPIEFSCRNKTDEDKQIEKINNKLVKLLKKRDYILKLYKICKKKEDEQKQQEEKPKKIKKVDEILSDIDLDDIEIVEV